MASIEPYDTAKGRRYMVRYRKPDRKPTMRRGFRTKREAQMFLNTVEVSKLEGLYVDPTAGKRTVASLGAHWLASQAHVKASSKKVYETALRIHVLPEFGALPVSGVKRAHVRDWVAGMTDRDKPLAARTVRRAHFVLQAILELAVDDKLIARNPAHGIKTLPSIRHRKNAYLTYEQVEEVAAAADRHHQVEHRGKYGFVVYIAAYMGLRWTEIATLRPTDVDLSAKRVTVRAEVSKNSQERSVGYPAFMHERFRELVLAADPGGVLIPSMRSPKTEESWFLGVRKRASLPEGFRFHDLRHSAASFAVSEGASVKVVQNMLGHNQAAVTLDVYADLFSTDVDDVAERIDAARNRSVLKMRSNDNPEASEG